MKVGLFAAALLIFVACGGPRQFYDGPRLSQPELAVVGEEGPLPSATIVSVNGKLVGKRGLTFSAELRPGRHTLYVQFRDMARSGAVAQPVTFTAEAGHRYVVGARLDGGRWLPTLRDVTTGTLIIR